MKRSAWTLLSILAGWALGSSAASQVSQADWDWFARYQDRAYEALMPMSLAPGQLVAYRSFRDGYVSFMERHFTVAYANEAGFDPDRLVATVVVPLARSIQGQLVEIHSLDRTASFETVFSKVSVQRRTVSSTTCEAIRRQMDALSNLVIKVPQRGLIVRSHPADHRFVIRVSPLNIDATVHGEGSPLVSWALETTDALLACAARHPGAIDSLSDQK